jgi:hypothetical protein
MGNNLSGTSNGMARYALAAVLYALRNKSVSMIEVLIVEAHCNGSI